MEFLETSIPGVKRIRPRVFSDTRGFFLDSYHRPSFEAAGLITEFLQDSHSRSRTRGVVRGLHFQLPPKTQAKLVRVVRGAVFDVVLDLRIGSPTYGKWSSYELSADNFEMLYIPRGLAHGFCTLTDDTEMLYKLDNVYAPEFESGVRWNDAELAIPWPTDNAVMSPKDAVLPLFADVHSPFGA